jgi:hypothetical protein
MLQIQTRRILREGPAAEYLGTVPSTLQKWRLIGKGPRWMRIGTRMIGYDVRELDSYIEQQSRSSTSDDPTPTDQSSKTVIAECERARQQARLTRLHEQTAKRRRAHRVRRARGEASKSKEADND